MVVGITGITSVVQVCDLVANKLLKHFIRDGYYVWRTAYIKKAKDDIIAKGGNPNNQRVKIKITNEEMTTIVEDAVKKFHEKQRETESIRKMFRKDDQDPWRDSSAQFKEHLDSLAKESMYKDNVAAQRIENATMANQQAEELGDD